jgi:hypothetical protein
MANATTNTNISINNKERLKLFEAVCDDIARCCCRGCADCVDCKCYLRFVALTRA